MMHRVNGHILTRGSLLDGQVIEALTETGKVEILYSDPPWNDAVLKMFATRARRNGVEVVYQPIYTEVCDRIGEFVRDWVTQYAFIEVSSRGVTQMTDAVGPHLSDLSVQKTVYGGREASIIYGVKGGLSLPQVPKGLGGFPLISACLGPVSKPGWTVFDPCCGSGMTGVIADKLGLRFVGNELDPTRLQIAQERLAGRTRSGR
jgi:hypothetical protein